MEQLLPAPPGFEQIEFVSGYRRVSLLELACIRTRLRPGLIYSGHYGFCNWDIAGHDDFPVPATVLAKWPGFREHQRLSRVHHKITVLTECSNVFFTAYIDLC